MNAKALIPAVLLFSALVYGQSGSTVTPDDYKRWRTELRNWGTVGPERPEGHCRI